MRALTGSSIEGVLCTSLTWFGLRFVEGVHFGISELTVEPRLSLVSSRVRLANVVVWRAGVHLLYSLVSIGARFGQRSGGPRSRALPRVCSRATAVYKVLQLYYVVYTVQL